jgi:Zn-finger nucleic acid-binding protein
MKKKCPIGCGVDLQEVEGSNLDFCPLCLRWFLVLDNKELVEVI